MPRNDRVHQGKGKLNPDHPHINLKDEMYTFNTLYPTICIKKINHSNVGRLFKGNIAQNVISNLA